MDVEIIHEKVKEVVLKEIKELAEQAWYKPTDDNVHNLFNAVEYLKQCYKSVDNIAEEQL